MTANRNIMTRILIALFVVTSSLAQNSTGSTDGPLVAIIIGSTVGVIIFIVVVIIIFIKFCRKEANQPTDETVRLSDYQKHRDECKSANDTTEMCGMYAEVTRTACEDHGDNVNEPQASILYATLELPDHNNARSGPSKFIISDGNGPTRNTGISQVLSQDANIYSEIMQQP